MASLRKHPKSRFWIGCFTDHTSTQRQRSTKTTDRVAALRIAVSWEDAYRRQMNEVQLRDVYSQISQEVNGAPLDFETTGKFFQGWLKNKQVERKQASYVKYEGVVQRFLKFLGPKTDKDVMSISAKEVSSYRNSLAESLKPSTVNGHLKVLRVAFEDAFRDGKIRVNPAKQVKTLRKGSGSARRPFTSGEISLILSVANNEWRGLILAGLCTGQRLGDIVRLRWANIDAEKKMISLTTGKTGERIAVWIFPPLWDYLMALPASDDPQSPIFPTALAAVEAAESVHPLSKQFHSLLVSVGLARKWESKKTGTGRSVARDNTGLSFHALRHTTVSFLKRAGVPEAISMAIVGHTSRAVSENYTHIDSETISTWMQSSAATFSQALTGSAGPQHVSEPVH